MVKLNTQCDVAIIGGGPAGLMTGILLARQGLTVRIFERQCHPRHHIGESLLPATFPILAKAGISHEELASRYQPKFGARFYDTQMDRITTFGFESHNTPASTPSLQVLREDFDSLLVERACTAGCLVQENAEVTQVDYKSASRHLTLTDGSSCGFNFVVDATGQSCMFARKRGTRQLVDGFGHVAVYNYFVDLPPHDQHDPRYITMYVFDGGWVWLIPLAGGVTSVGVVLSRRCVVPGQTAQDQFDRVTATMPRLHRRLQAAKATAPFRTIADYSYRVTEKHGDHFLLVGDAAGFLDPIFSSGVHLAISSADAAADAIVQTLKHNNPSALPQYDAYMRRGFAVFERFVDWFYHRHLVRDLFFMPNQPANIRQAIVDILAGYVWDLNNPLIKTLETSHQAGKTQCATV